MIHYIDRCCIYLDNWNIFQQHNSDNYAWFFCFHDDNENEAVEDSKTKKPRHRDSKTKKPRHRDSGSKTSRHREAETNKPRHRDSTAFFSEDIEISRLPRHRDSKTKKPRHRVPVEFWSLCPLINNSDCVIFGNGASGEIKDHSLSRMDFLKNF